MTSEEQLNELLSNDDITRDLIMKNYYEISRTIDPNKYISWLIQEGVLSEEDSEHIRNGSDTSRRAEILLEKLRRRGKEGLKKFLLITSYEHPDIFTKITGIKEPIIPPNSYTLKRFNSNSIRKIHQRQLTELVHSFQSEVNNEISKISSSFLMDREIRKAYDKIDTIQNDLEEYKEKCELFESQLEKKNKDIKQLTEKNELLQSDKNNFKEVELSLRCIVREQIAKIQNLEEKLAEKQRISTQFKDIEKLIKSFELENIKTLNLQREEANKIEETHQLSEKQIENNALENEVRNYKEKCEELQKYIDEIKNETKTTINRYKDLANKNENECKALSERVDVLQSILDGTFDDKNNAEVILNDEVDKRIFKEESDLL